MWRGREARTGRGGDKQREGEKARWKGQGREEGGGSVVRHTKSRRMPALLLAGEFLRRVCPRARGFLRRVWRAQGGGGGGVGDRERHFEVLALELAERLLHDA